jgi:hypothetical protein
VSRSGRTRALTLLELLLVVVILAALATAAVATLEQTDLQSRHDETRARAHQVADAIVGPNRTLNGTSQLSGFVADMGRLPVSLSELSSQGALASYVEDFGGSAVGAGWRGPYVHADQDGTFRDGWANGSGVTADPNFGWVVTVTGTPFAGFTLTSLGSDGAAGGTTWDAADVSTALLPDDYLVRVSSWSVDVVFTNTGAATWSQNVRLRIYAPSSGGDASLASVWPATAAAADAAPFLSLASVVSVPSASSTRVTFTFLDPVSGADKRMPIGLRTLAVVDAATGAAAGSARPVPVALAPRASLPVLTGPAATPVAWTVP